MTDPLTPERLAELRRIATGEDWSPPQPQDVAALLGEIDRLTTALSDSQAECGALRGGLIRAFGERDTMQRRAYSAYVRADSIRALAEQLRKLTRFMLDGEPQSPGWGTAELLARQVLMAIGPAMPYGASPAAPQRLVTTLAVDFPSDAAPEPQRPAEGLQAGTHTCTGCDGTGERRDFNTDGDVESAQRCPACDGAGRVAIEIVPEDEGIATADVTAQQAADQRAYCPDCGHPETNCACG